MRATYTSSELVSDQSEEPERRASSRVQTVLRVARAIADSDHGLARVRNISDQGAQLRLQIPVRIGDALTLELAEGVTSSGQVVWTAGYDCGVKFDRDIDCAELLKKLASSAKMSSTRPLRLPVAISAVTRGENGIRLTKVTDVSQRGMKLRHDGSFTAGLQVKITLPSGLERCGVVRWSKDDFAGVMLVEPFSTDELGSVRNL